MKLLLKVLVLAFALITTPKRINGGHLTPIIIYSNSEYARGEVRFRKDDLQRIFTRKVTRWDNGGEIIVYIKPMGSIEHRDFVSSVLGMTPYRYKKTLEVNTYNASTVQEVNSDAEMQAAVYLHPGAIGYLNYGTPPKSKFTDVCAYDEDCDLKMQK